ncbi:MAG: hypothetical protein IE922_08655 [Sphingomonadales bacterium]|nr:hypothetical protein [Sphingomonadales bacterium]
MDHRKEIDRLYKLEYGRPGELVFRFVGLGLGALIIYQYTGWIASWVWLVNFVAGHLVYLLFLRSRPARCTGRDTGIATGLFLWLLASFLWMPVELMASPDPAMMLSGAALFGSGLVYMIFRADRMAVQVWGEIAVIWAMCVLALVQVMGAIPDPLARLGVSVAVLALGVYFAITLLAARKARLEAELAALRSVQAQKMEAVGQLTGGIAHDFNNILTAVIGNLELYEAVPDPVERDRFVAQSRAAALRAAGLVQHLLAYSRKSTMTIAVHDTADLIEEVRALTCRLIPTSIAVEIDVPPALPVAVDQSQFMTALVNLVVNARDAMQKTGGQLAIRVGIELRDQPLVQSDGYQLPPGSYVRIAVEDSGPGIPPEILRRVTEPFFTTKPVGQGSGLGLSMVEGFARQSHGALQIGNTRSGARVAILLPLAKCRDAALQPSKPEVLPQAQTPADTPAQGSQAAAPALPPAGARVPSPACPGGVSATPRLGGAPPRGYGFKTG